MLSGLSFISPIFPILCVHRLPKTNEPMTLGPHHHGHIPSTMYSIHCMQQLYLPLQLLCSAFISVVGSLYQMVTLPSSTASVLQEGDNQKG